MRPETDLLLCSAFFLSSIFQLDFTRSPYATPFQSARLQLQIVHVAKASKTPAWFYYADFVYRIVNTMFVYMY